MDSARIKKTIPTLLPLFRNDNQAVILTSLLLGEVEQSIADLTRSTHLAKNSVRAEIDLLQVSGVVSSRTVGRSRLVSFCAPQPYRRVIEDLVLFSYGLQQVLSETLSEVAGIEQAYIFGSWADRFLNKPGKFPGNIDVVVIGDFDRFELAEATREASARLGKEVNPLRETRERWDDPTNAFYQSIKGKSLVPIQIG